MQKRPRRAGSWACDISTCRRLFLLTIPAKTTPVKNWQRPSKALLGNEPDVILSPQEVVVEADAELSRAPSKRLNRRSASGTARVSPTETRHNVGLVSTTSSRMASG